MSWQPSTYRLAGGGLHALNKAFIFLLPKKGEASLVGDYRPISLIHSFAKLISKVQARRLAPELSSVISHTQSAFLKHRCLHDNFLFIRSLSRALHRRKIPSLLVKLDFARAFDSVSWDYLLELMQHLGFSARWRDWISMLLTTSSSAVLLNGVAGLPFLHRRGLRQGDPLSPPLFIMAIDPLHRLLELATEAGALSPLHIREAKFRASLYADDAIVFIKPLRQEVSYLLRILQLFGEATGLRINARKCSVSPIRCDQVDLDSVLQEFLGARAVFPIRYLGMPIALGRLRYVDLQHIIDRARSKLAGWRGHWINAGGRRTLTIAVLSTLPIFALTALKAPKKFVKDFDRIQRNFTWGIEENEVAGGKCKIGWPMVCSPTSFGGLGLPNLSLFSRALRLRWMWYEWTAPQRPWVSTPTPCDID